nr:hypothetical protein [Mesotoga infera]
MQEKEMKYYSLIDKVYSKKNLLKAYHRVNSNRGAPGIDGVTVKSFGEKLLEEIERLSEEIKSGEYMPMPLRRVEIPKADGKTRQLGSTYCERQGGTNNTLKEILEPIFEERFHPPVTVTEREEMPGRRWRRRKLLHPNTVCAM